jgi:hypothetical protein
VNGVSIASGTTATVPFAGADYDVTVEETQIQVTSAENPLSCADYFGPDNSDRVHIKMKDLAGAAAKLETGALPACARGSASREWVNISQLGSASSSYDGPVVYAKRGTSEGGRECFDFTANVSVGSDLLEVCTNAGRFREPKVGDTFWLSQPNYSIAALRKAQGGPVLLASVEAWWTTTSPAATIEQALGLRVDFAKGCPYATEMNGSGPATTLSLIEAKFATTPATIVHSDDHAVLTIGGQSYDVWVTGDYRDTGASAGFTLIARGS